MVQAPSPLLADVNDICAPERLAVGSQNDILEINWDRYRGEADIGKSIAISLDLCSQLSEVRKGTANSDDGAVICNSGDEEIVAATESARTNKRKRLCDEEEEEEPEDGTGMADRNRGLESESWSVHVNFGNISREDDDDDIRGNKSKSMTKSKIYGLRSKEDRNKSKPEGAKSKGLEDFMLTQTNTETPQGFAQSKSKGVEGSGQAKSKGGEGSGQAKSKGGEGSTQAKSKRLQDFIPIETNTERLQNFKAAKSRRDEGFTLAKSKGLHDFILTETNLEGLQDFTQAKSKGGEGSTLDKPKGGQGSTQAKSKGLRDFILTETISKRLQDFNQAKSKGDEGAIQDKSSKGGESLTQAKSKGLRDFILTETNSKRLQDFNQAKFKGDEGSTQDKSSKGGEGSTQAKSKGLRDFILTETISKRLQDFNQAKSKGDEGAIQDKSSKGGEGSTQAKSKGLRDFILTETNSERSQDFTQVKSKGGEGASQDKSKGGEDFAQAKSKGGEGSTQAKSKGGKCSTDAKSKGLHDFILTETNSERLQDVTQAKSKGLRDFILTDTNSERLRDFAQAKAKGGEGLTQAKSKGLRDFMLTETNSDSNQTKCGEGVEGFTPAKSERFDDQSNKSKRLQRLDPTKSQGFRALESRPITISASTQPPEAGPSSKSKNDKSETNESDRTYVSSNWFEEQLILKYLPWASALPSKSHISETSQTKPEDDPPVESAEGSIVEVSSTDDSDQVYVIEGGTSPETFCENRREELREKLLSSPRSQNRWDLLNRESDSDRTRIDVFETTPGNTRTSSKGRSETTSENTRSSSKGRSETTPGNTRTSSPKGRSETTPGNSRTSSKGRSETTPGNTRTSSKGRSETTTASGSNDKGIIILSDIVIQGAPEVIEIDTDDEAASPDPSDWLDKHHITRITCPTCKRKVVNYKRHVFEYHTEAKYVCNICQAAYKRSADLGMHKKSRHH